jgi:hypothetical protein
MFSSANRVNKNFKIKPFVLTNIVKKYTNLEDEKKRKIRELKDTSTKCFVNIFFNSSDILFKFVYWVYHKINCALLKIEKTNCYADEKIIFFFKGGNIMFLWRQKFEEIFGDVNKDIGSKTSISDCDFSIYILTKDERRYNEIYSEINSVLIIELEEIGAMFDELYLKSIYAKRRNNKPNNSPNNRPNNSPNNGPNNTEFSCDKFKRNEKRIFNDFFRDFYSEKKIIELLKNITDELEKLKGTDNNFYEEKNYEIYKYNIPDNYIIHVANRESLILRPEDKVPDSFSLTNFSNKKLHYVTVNANIFNNLAKAGHLVGFDLYRIKFNTIIDKIIKSKKTYPNRNNFNRPDLQEDFGIPSEFIDISVSKFYDLNLQKLREDFYSSKNKSVLQNKFALIGCTFSDGTVLPQSILTMQLKYIVDDLLLTLFSQNFYNPMIDPKYEKRLFRIFFFYIGNNLRKGTTIIPYNIFDVINSSNRNIYNRFYQYFLASRDNLDIDYIINMKGKLIHNFFNIKDEFNDLKYLLQFTILFNKIIDNNEVLSQFIEYYNNIYNIINNNNLQDFKVKFYKFKDDLNTNYTKAYDYFRNSGLVRVSILAGGGEENTKKSNITNSNKSQGTTPKTPFRTNSTNKKMNKQEILNELLFDIGDDVKLEYKDIDLQIRYEERKYYPSFEFDDDM